MGEHGRQVTVAGRPRGLARTRRNPAGLINGDVDGTTRDAVGQFTVLSAAVAYAAVGLAVLAQGGAKLLQRLRVPGWGPSSGLGIVVARIK